jgi:hypothetical protein
MRLSVIMSMHTSEFLKKEIFPQKWKLFVQEQSKNLYLKFMHMTRKLSPAVLERVQIKSAPVS